jgi:hypothetical protein
MDETQVLKPLTAAQARMKQAPRVADRPTLHRAFPEIAIGGYEETSLPCTVVGKPVKGAMLACCSRGAGPPGSAAPMSLCPASCLGCCRVRLFRAAVPAHMSDRATQLKARAAVTRTSFSSAGGTAGGVWRAQRKRVTPDQGPRTRRFPTPSNGDCHACSRAKKRQLRPPWLSSRRSEMQVSSVPSREALGQPSCPDSRSSSEVKFAHRRPDDEHPSVSSDGGACRGPSVGLAACTGTEREHRGVHRAPFLVRLAARHRRRAANRRPISSRPR